MPHNEKTPVLPGVSREALYRTRTDDPFLTMVYGGTRSHAGSAFTEDPTRPERRQRREPTPQRTPNGRHHKQVCA